MISFKKTSRSAASFGLAAILCGTSFLNSSCTTSNPSGMSLVMKHSGDPISRIFDGMAYLNGNESVLNNAMMRENMQSAQQQSTGVLFASNGVLEDTMEFISPGKEVFEIDEPRIATFYQPPLAPAVMVKLRTRNMSSGLERESKYEIIRSNSVRNYTLDDLQEAGKYKVTLLDSQGRAYREIRITIRNSGRRLSSN